MTDATLSHIWRKASSVRVITTLAAVGLWWHLAATKQLPAEFSAGLISLIVNWYFRDRTDKDGGNV